MLTAAVTLAAIAVAPAHAAPQKKLDAEEARQLEASFGGRGAGIYYDRESANMVVAVTDDNDSERVRAQGGIARKVANSGGKLEAITGALKKKINIAGTSWGIDPIENKVVVSLDETVDAGESGKVREAVEGAPEAVRIERVKGQFKPLISGGEAIFGGSSRCSLGFNVMRGTVPHFLTAGHCTNISSTWTPVASTRVGSSFPGNDYGLVKYNSASPLQAGNVSLYNGTFQEITSAAHAVVGMAAKRSGSTTGLRSGTVSALNQTVNYAGGQIVSGLIRTNICAQPGDSGGSLFAGTLAVGLTSGGSGNCTTGGTTFFQPVMEALSVYGLTIY